MIAVYWLTQDDRRICGEKRLERVLKFSVSKGNRYKNKRGESVCTLAEHSSGLEEALGDQTLPVQAWKCTGVRDNTAVADLNPLG